MDLSPRVRAVCDLDVAGVREECGRHEYDGKPQDLSPVGVRAGLARLAQTSADGERLADAHDEAQLTAAQEQKRVVYQPVRMVQEFRKFDFLSPWEGAKYVLPGDEKAGG